MVSNALPPDWRKWDIHTLREWVRTTRRPGEIPYLDYKRKRELVAYVEQHVTVPRCPTCGQPI